MGDFDGIKNTTINRTFRKTDAVKTAEKPSKLTSVGLLATKYFSINRAKYPIKPIPYSDMLFTKYIKCSPCNVRQLVTMKVPVREK